MRTNGRYHEDYDHDNPREIERELQETRRRIDETVHDIERRFSPGELLDQGIHYLRRGPGQFGGNLARTVRDNPVPVLLVGIGLTWLAIAESAYAEMGVDFDQLIEEGKRRQEKERDLGEVTSQAKERAFDVKNRAQEAAHGLRERGREAAHGLRERGREAAHGVRERGRGLGEQGRRVARRGRHAARRAREGMAGQMQDNPLLVAALGVAAGAIIGSMIPTSRRERELLGDVAGKAKRKGQEVASKVGDVAKEAAREGARAAEETAKRHMPSESEESSERGESRRFEGEFGGPGVGGSSGVEQEERHEVESRTIIPPPSTPRGGDIGNV